MQRVNTSVATLLALVLACLLRSHAASSAYRNGPVEESVNCNGTTDPYEINVDSVKDTFNNTKVDSTTNIDDSENYTNAPSNSTDVFVNVTETFRFSSLLYISTRMNRFNNGSSDSPIDNGTSSTTERDKRPPVAKARTGTYVGYWSVTKLGTKYASFSGIRFAKPMTPLNRFKWAELVEDSAEVVSARREGADCVQWNLHEKTLAITGQEDCLFLNIYSPDVSKSLPVMVVLPCGHFALDSASRNLNGPDYFMDTKEIVVVAVNYRLGPLGFANFRSDKYPANLGMKDQVVALQWLQRNIKGFGGDPSRVTLQGTSSGAVSVHFHMMSPLSKGLFHAGISESGTAMDSWAIAYPHLERDLLTMVATGTNCTWAMPSSLLAPADVLAECLSNRSAQDILAATRQFDFRMMQMVFLPVIENTTDRPFLPDDPYVAAEDSLPWLSGQNSDEAGIITPMEGPWYLLVRYYLTLIVYDAVPHWLNYFETASNPRNVTGRIMQHYAGTYWPSQQQIIPTLRKAGGVGIFWNTHYMSLLKHQGPKYSYLFSYRQTEPNGSFLHPDQGVTHSEELFYLFIKQGRDIQSQNPPADARMSRTLVRLWVNFVKYFNPTPKTETQFPKWELWTSENNLYYHIGQDFIKMIVDPKLDEYEFWKTLPYRDKMKPFQFYPDDKKSTSNTTDTSTPPANSTTDETDPPPSGCSTITSCRYLSYLIIPLFISIYING